MGINTDEDGFVLDPEDWNEDFASSTAEQYEIELNEDHWRVIHLIRQLYSESGVVPELRIILRNLREQIGKDNATRKYVYALFPYGYGQQGCKIAGMRKPLKLWLDVWFLSSLYNKSYLFDSLYVLQCHLTKAQINGF